MLSLLNASQACSYLQLYLFENIDVACIGRQLQALGVSHTHVAAWKCADTKVVHVVIPTACYVGSDLVWSYLLLGCASSILH